MGFRRQRQGYHTSGSRVNGRWQEGAQTPFNFSASIQPVTGTELENTPELRRRKAAVYKVYTNEVLQTVQTSDNPDLVEYNGSLWEVIMEQNWDNNVINHRKYFIEELTDK